MCKIFQVIVATILVCTLIQSCHETLKNNKGAYYGKDDYVDVQFQTAFKADTVTLAINETKIYSSILTTDWSLGYSDHTLVSDSLFKQNGQLIIKVNKLQAIIKYQPNFRFINVNRINKDSLDVQLSDDPIQYM